MPSALDRQTADMGYLPGICNARTHCCLRPAMVPHLGGGDDDVLVVLAGQDDGALRLQVEVLLAAHADAALHNMSTLLPGRAHVAAHDVVPCALHAAARLHIEAQGQATPWMLTTVISCFPMRKGSRSCMWQRMLVYINSASLD